MSTAYNPADHPRDEAGRWANKSYADPGQLDLGGSRDELIRAHRPGLIALHTPSQGDRLSAFQANALLMGAYDAAHDNLEDELQFDKEATLEEAMRAWARDAGLDFDDLTEEERAEMEDYLWGNDDSDTLDTLIWDDPPRMVRAPLADAGELGADKLYAARDDRALDARADKVAQVLRANGVEDEDAHRAARELVAEGPRWWGKNVGLDVVFAASVGEVAPSLDGAAASTTQVSMRQAHVVLMDRSTGTGTSTVVGQMSFEAPIGGPRALRLDDDPENNWQMSWTESSAADIAAYRPADLTRTDHLDPRIAQQNARMATEYASDIDTDAVRSALAGEDRAAKHQAFSDLTSAYIGTHKTIAQGLAPYASVQQVDTALAHARAASDRRTNGEHPLDTALAQQFQAAHGREPRDVYEAWDDRARRSFDDCLNAPRMDQR